MLWYVMIVHYFISSVWMITHVSYIFLLRYVYECEAYCLNLMYCYCYMFLHLAIIIIIYMCIYLGNQVLNVGNSWWTFQYKLMAFFGLWNINDIRFETKYIKNTFSVICFPSETFSITFTQRLPLGNGGPSDLLRRDGVPLRSPDCKKLKWTRKKKDFVVVGGLEKSNCISWLWGVPSNNVIKSLDYNFFSFYKLKWT